MVVYQKIRSYHNRNIWPYQESYFLCWKRLLPVQFELEQQIRTNFSVAKTLLPNEVFPRLRMTAFYNNQYLAQEETIAMSRDEGFIVVGWCFLCAYYLCNIGVVLKRFKRIEDKRLFRGEDQSNINSAHLKKRRSCPSLGALFVALTLRLRLLICRAGQISPNIYWR